MIDAINRSPGALRLVLPCLLLLIAGSAQSETKRIRFDDGEGCRYEIRLDTARTPEAAVRGTIRLLFDLHVQSVDKAVWQISKPEDIDSIDMNGMEEQCRARTSLIAGTPVLPLLEDHKRRLLEDVADACAYARIKYAAYRDPSALRRYTPAAACLHFVDALEGKTDLEVAYRKLSEENCQSNASPARCLERWRERAKDPRMIELELINFGWNNCALQFNKRVTMGDATRERLAALFLKQYRVRKLKCDQP